MGTFLPRILVFATLAAIAPEVPATPPPASIVESPMDRMFDPDSLVTVEGTVVAVHRRVRGPQDECMVLLTPTGTLDVHLGPVAWVDAQPVQLHAGDRITVRGSKVSLMGSVAVIAVEVRRGGQVLSLREADGSPRWRAAAGAPAPAR